MHRCLGILEILEGVCTHLDPTVSFGDDEARGALATLARTCTITSGPALNMLWKTQKGLNPFLELFPGDLFVPPGSQYPPIWRMGRPVMPQDFQRPLMYAARIQILSSYHDSDRFSEILLFLSACWPSGFLFPNLRKFRWVRAKLFHMHIFCPPTLIGIDLRSASSNITSFLPTLAASCPGLKHVSLEFDSLEFDSATVESGIAASAFICGLHNINTLRLVAPTIEALRHIAHLPGLTSLIITELPRPGVWALTRSTPSIFSHLRRLILGPLAIEPATHFLSCFDKSQLLELHIDLDTCATAVDTNLLFDTVRVAFSHTSLHTFTLGNHPYDFRTARQRKRRINYRSLDILSCFTEITSLAIQSPAGFDLDDAAVERLAAAWPRLEDLTLSARGRSTPIHLTFHALRSLASHCPFLTELDIEFDATHTPPGSADERVVQDTLDRLLVGFSPIIKPGRVARYLSRLFPNLSDISATHSKEYNEDKDDVEMLRQTTVWDQLWKQVEEHVPEYAATRQEGHALQT
ncbi:hypothetical protein C8R47DRAFT_1165033 [Mycena vitilis]|nr:hypothetical protein C8R47DRAFT_1165033 [Mycena vitilis]